MEKVTDDGRAKEKSKVAKEPEKRKAKEGASGRAGQVKQAQPKQAVASVVQRKEQQ